MMNRTAAISMFCFVHAALASASSSSEGFLGGISAEHRATDRAFREAMEDVVACGGAEVEDATADDSASQLEEALLPLWSVLPKNRYGRIEWNLLRYVVHRHFMRESSLLIRGFEPSRQVNASSLGVAGLLSQNVPTGVDEVLREKHATIGYSLGEVAMTVAAVQRQIREQERELLQKVFGQLKRPLGAKLSKAELSNVVEAYVINWMMADADHATIMEVLGDRKLLKEMYPRWEDANNFAAGIVESIAFSRKQAPRAGDGSAVMLGMYTFEDAWEAASTITKGFAEYWEAECQTIKTSLVELDKDGSGRVRFEDFYGTNDDGEWRFGESEAYLKELGTLDESSHWRGKQVIIPNYLQGASNCIVTSPNYLVCCVNECETILKDIEDRVGGPVADPEELRAIVGNMTDFDDKEPAIDDLLEMQLRQIAAAHGGKVPLYGRLFSQWIHYVFPQECPFPHMTGTAAATTPSEFQGEFAVTDAEVAGHSRSRNFSLSLEELKEVESLWMTLWSEEEELLADYDQHLQTAWTMANRWKLAAFGLLMVLCVVSLAIVDHHHDLPKWLSPGRIGKRVHFL